MQNFKDTFYKNIWPVLAGIFTASITMMTLEFINSKMYPFPENFDKYDSVAITTFTNFHSPNIFILVGLGWLLGGFFGGYILTKVSERNFTKKENIKTQLIILATFLAFSGFMNLLILNTAYTFHIVGIISFFITTYLGYKFGTNK
jgi:hypothetical protein